MRSWGRLVAALVLVGAVAAGAALAQEGPKLQIGGTTYTKWLWGNMRTDGSVYNFTTVPGEGYGDNGQGSEVELLLYARLSSQVEVRARLHSRFNQNQWTNFGGFGGVNPATQDPPPSECVSGDCGEFDPRSNQYVKLRGVAVTLTPGYSWVDSINIGASDFGMFDPFVAGRIRYIDRDNASGLLFQGSSAGRAFGYDVARISLPRLWAGPDFRTTPNSIGGFHASDAAYVGQFRYSFSPQFDVAMLAQWVNDMEVDPIDNILDDGADHIMRFRNISGGIRVGVHPSSTLDIRAAYYTSESEASRTLSPASFFSLSGFSPTLAGKHDDDTWKANIDLNDIGGSGFSLHLEAFDIGAEYVSMMAARRESDVLLTEGHDATWAFPGPANASFGVFAGNPTRIGYGGWMGNAQQVATINVDNEFTDFDEPLAETAIGWKGFTLVPVWSSGDTEIGAEATYIDYNTNWQGFGEQDPDLPLGSTEYPVHELDTGVGHNYRSAYAPFQDKETKIALVRAKTVVDFGKGIDLFGKVKWIDETDNRLNSRSWLDDAIAAFYGDPHIVGELPTEQEGLRTKNGWVGNSWKPFSSLSDDDRDLEYWLYQVGAGYQLTDDLYGSLTYEYYDVDLFDGNTAFQGYNLHEMASGKHEKNIISAQFRYVLAGAEFGLVYQHNFGTFEPDFGPQGEGKNEYVPLIADEEIAAQHNVPVGSEGFLGRFGGWNSLEKREFRQNRIKAFMKVQF
ncbi:MAG: hypothetical protein KBD01_16490 [Acidobacteria bacterium]|nr:hypothetical protein [Acidobacteriota bacterium]